MQTRHLNNPNFHEISDNNIILFYPILFYTNCNGEWQYMVAKANYEIDEPIATCIYNATFNLQIYNFLLI